MCSKISNYKKERTAEKENYGEYPNYGYTMKEEEHSKLVIDHETAKVVSAIFECFIEGERLGDIANNLNAKQIDTPAILFRKERI